MSNENIEMFGDISIKRNLQEELKDNLRRALEHGYKILSMEFDSDQERTEFLDVCMKVLKDEEENMLNLYNEYFTEEELAKMIEIGKDPMWLRTLQFQIDVMIPFTDKLRIKMVNKMAKIKFQTDKNVLFSEEHDEEKYRAELEEIKKNIEMLEPPSPTKVPPPRRNYSGWSTE